MRCLDEATLTGYLSGRLSESQFRVVEEHLDSCEECRELVLLAARHGWVRDEASAFLKKRTAEDRTSASDQSDGYCNSRVSPTRAPLQAEPDQEDPFALGPEGRYQVLAQGGSGGQATVYVAYDTLIGREVALKVVPQAMDTDTASEQSSSGPPRTPAERLLREARIAGRLAHPSILHVYDLGRHSSGHMYYTMPMVRGMTLAEALSRRASLTERLELVPHVLDVCNAVAYAHSRRVIHRASHKTL